MWSIANYGVVCNGVGKSLSNKEINNIANCVEDDEVSAKYLEIYCFILDHKSVSVQ